MLIPEELKTFSKAIQETREELVQAARTPFERAVTGALSTVLQCEWRMLMELRALQEASS